MCNSSFAIQRFPARIFQDFISVNFLLARLATFSELSLLAVWFTIIFCLTLSWRRPLSYWNQSSVMKGLTFTSFYSYTPILFHIFTSNMEDCWKKDKKLLMQKLKNICFKLHYLDYYLEDKVFFFLEWITWILLLDFAVLNVYPFYFHLSITFQQSNAAD